MRTRGGVKPLQGRISRCLVAPSCEQHWCRACATARSAVCFVLSRRKQNTGSAGRAAYNIEGGTATVQRRRQTPDQSRELSRLAKAKQNHARFQCTPVRTRHKSCEPHTPVRSTPSFDTSSPVPSRQQITAVLQEQISSSSPLQVLPSYAVVTSVAVRWSARSLAATDEQKLRAR